MEKEGESAPYRNNLLKLHIRSRCEDKVAYDELERLAEAPSSSHPTPEDALVARGYLGLLVTLSDFNTVINFNEKRGHSLLSELSVLDQHSLTCSHLQLLLGVYYDDCCDGKEKEAIELYQKSANNDHVLSMLRLGYCFNFGNFLRQNYDKSFSLFMKAAEMEYPLAQFNLGIYYTKGRGCEKNLDAAFKWYRRAADHGYTEAAFVVGTLYYLGRGVSQDFEIAVQHFKLAADKGFCWAQHRLGLCYRSGEGVPKDWQQAARLMMSAVQGGIPHAADYLGNAYEYGEGVDVNIVEAMRYYRKAVALNESRGSDEQYDMSKSSTSILMLSGRYKSAVRYQLFCHMLLSTLTSYLLGVEQPQVVFDVFIGMQIYLPPWRLSS